MLYSPGLFQIYSMSSPRDPLILTSSYIVQLPLNPIFFTQFDTRIRYAFNKLPRSVSPRCCTGSTCMGNPGSSNRRLHCAEFYLSSNGHLGARDPRKFFLVICGRRGNLGRLISIHCRRQIQCTLPLHRCKRQPTEQLQRRLQSRLRLGGMCRQCYCELRENNLQYW